MPKWAWVSYSVKEGSGQNSSGPPFHYRSSPVPNGQGLSPLGKCLSYNEKRRGSPQTQIQRARTGMEIMSYYQPPCLSHIQCSLQPGWWAERELNALSQVVFHSYTEKPAFIFKTRKKESTVKIFEQSIQTPCGLYWRQAAREQLLRMGNEETQAVQWGFFVMGCQNGFDLLRDLLIINCIICFLLHSSQEKRTPTLHLRPGHNSYHQREWLDGSWLCRLSADGS